MKALITGGERGLGLALSKLLINEGYEVISLDLKKGINIKNKKFIKTDITDEKQVINAFKKINEIDILINNAAIMKRGTTFSSTIKDFDLLFSINVKGTWLIIKYALEKLQQKSKIIMISSRHSSLPTNPGLYGLTKKNTELLAELLKKESVIKIKKIKIKIASLGPFKTNLSKTGYTEKEYKKRKISTKEEKAQKVINLIFSNKKSIREK